jgi:hypothetical protein
MESMLDIDEAWESFCNGSYDPSPIRKAPPVHALGAPRASDLYVSTKTKLSYLNSQIDLASVFWGIDVVPYHQPRAGVIKKEMKFNCEAAEELEHLQSKMPKDATVEEHVITHIENPEGRIKFKDVRKISVGICKKDLVSSRGKKKGAFYNCFVVIVRILYKGEFKEIHVKVFNTGKLKIPGIQDNAVLDAALDQLVRAVRPICPEGDKLAILEGKTETVLINSNFNCGYYINRSKLFEILKTEKLMNCAYDPCSYPGIHSEFYYKVGAPSQDGRQPSADEAGKHEVLQLHFKVFRTGSVLILGKCSEDVICEIYDFLRVLLEETYPRVGAVKSDEPADQKAEKKPRKTRRRLLVAV